MNALSRGETDRPFLGVLLMLGFCCLAPVADALAKVLGSSVPLVQLLFARFLIQGVFLLPLTDIAGGALRVPPGLWGAVILRTALHIAGIGAMFTALRFMPLADTVAIAFVMPFVMLLLGHFFLGEVVGMRRINACVVGFVGTLLVIQPSFGLVGWPALLPLVVAVVFAFFMLVTRQIAKQIDPLGLQAISGFVGSVMLILVYLAGFAWPLPDLQLVMTDTWQSSLLLAVGIVGTVAHLLMTWSLRFAPSTTLAPMQYLEIPMATLVGWIVFTELPNGLAAIGIAVTVAAGLYIVMIERSRAVALA